MQKTVQWFVVSLLVSVTLVTLVGFVTFTILADDIYVELPDGTVVPYESFERMETTASTTDLIVLAAPSVNNQYYAGVFSDIIDFNVAYATAVLESGGTDEIRILVDAPTRQYFAGRVPEHVLVEANVADIWMRDFTTVQPEHPIQFAYTAASLDGVQAEAKYIQSSFNRFANRVGFDFPKTNLLIDGGNIVDNYAGRVVTTDRFLADNNLTKAQGVDMLKQLLGATEVAIIPADDPVLGHSDGMVMFVSEDTLVVNRYDEPFRSSVLAELAAAFPGSTVVEIEAAWEDETWDGTIGSACGINVNSVVTTNHIYVPHFGDAASDAAIATIADYTDKTVVPVPAGTVCQMGGSVRCLSWQLRGAAAQSFMGAL